MAVERRAEAGIGAGRHAEVVAGLAVLAAAHPGREHLTSLLMLALYRSGRQIEALDAFQRHRRRLADELGIEPDEELVALEQAILRHDEGLGPPPGPAPAQPRGNVRLPVSSFVGRADELRRTVEALRGAAPVTLTGPGGVGKTRLALESAVAAAAEFPGGTWLVDLAGLTDPAHVVHQLAVTLAVGDPRDDDEEATVLAALANTGRLLVVLDNCEHLLARCAELVDRVARACPGARVLATSRQPLGVDGETRPRPRPAARGRGLPAVRGPGAAPRGGRRRRRAPSGARHLPGPRRAAAGLGARGRAGAGLRPGRARRPPRRPAPVRQPTVRRPGAPADPAGHGGVEPRPAPRADAARVRPSGCLRVHADGVRSGRCRRPGRRAARRQSSSTSRCSSGTRTPAAPHASGCWTPFACSHWSN